MTIEKIKSIYPASTVRCRRRALGRSRPSRFSGPVPRRSVRLSELHWHILRDISEGMKMGRVYLPKDELDRFGYSEDDIRNGVVNDNFRELMGFQVERARKQYSLAQKGIPYLTNDGSRTTVVMMSKIYSGILDRIESIGYDVYSRRAYVNILDKLKIAGKYFINLSEKKRYSTLPDTHVIDYKRPQFQSIDT